MITFAPYKAGDEVSILNLFAEVFGKSAAGERPEAVWRWQYRDNPAGPTSILLAWRSERLVGQYAVSPRKLIWHGNLSLGALSLDTMVHASCQGCGLFQQMASGLYEEFKNSGGSCVLGFPNENSIGGFKRKLGWEIDGQACVMAVPTLARVNGKSASETVQSIDNSNNVGWEEVAALATASFAEYDFYVLRDAAYLEWRYRQLHDRKYRFYSLRESGELRGFAVIRVSKVKGIRAAFVMDSFFSDIKSGERLMRHVRRELLKNGVVMMMALLHPRDMTMAGSLRRFGFMCLPKRVYSSPLYFGFRDFTSRNSDGRWFLSWSDTDLL